MPKVKPLFQSKFAEWLRKLPEKEQKCFKPAGIDLTFCNVCCKNVTTKKKYQLDQHISTGTHVLAVERSNGVHQARFTDEMKSKDSFNEDLCKAFIAADIPFKKLENPVLKQFLEKYLCRSVPSGWTLRNKNVEQNYNNVIAKIRDELEHEYIWLAIDETTDKCGRFVANVMVGSLNGTASKPHLLMSRELETTDNFTVTRMVRDALRFLWPKREEKEINRLFVVLLSDAAPYMIKTGKNLKTTYPGLLHVTCLSHGLHRVAETVRASYNDVDRLIGAIKAVFKKSPYRVRKYNEMLPGLRLPPEPVLTRWGTWLEAVDFLCTNFEGIRSVIHTFDETEAECIRKAQKLIEKSNIKEALSFISANYGFLSNSIKLLETRNLLLTEAVRIVDEAQQRINSCDSTIGTKIKNKMENVLAKNPNFKCMRLVSDVLRGNRSETIDLDPSLIASLKYCPLTSVEVERGFSMEKILLSDRRRNFTMKNIEMYAVCHFEMNVTESMESD